MNIKPVTRAINYNQYTDWFLNHFADKNKYDTFVNEMTEKGYTQNKIDELWLHNYGAIPLDEPDRLYYCNIIDSSMKVTLIILRKSNILEGERRFKVVKLNHLHLDSYDHYRTITKENGKIVMKAIYKDLSLGLTNKTINHEDSLNFSDGTYMSITGLSRKNDVLNYEDSNWFTSMAVEDLLSRLRIKINPYEMPIGDEIPKSPTLNIANLDFMESTQFEITDKVFESALYEYIELKFETLESVLK